MAKLGSVCRRIYRIFSHAYFHHRQIFDKYEVGLLWSISMGGVMNCCLDSSAARAASTHRYLNVFAASVRPQCFRAFISLLLDARSSSSAAECVSLQHRLVL